jgi:ClpP class serine protease
MWLLEKNALEKFRQFVGYDIKPTQEQLAKFSEIEASTSRILNINDDKAIINVNGILTHKPDFFAMLFGGGNTTYTEITQALAVAERDKNIKSAEMRVDSPGGTVAGLFDAMEDISNFSKPINSVITNQAQSAAFGLISQTDSITATNKSISVGSIGVAVDIPVSDRFVSITSTKAPKKRPDVKTEEGREVVREELDAIHNLFVESIAQGRNTDSKTVNKEFGQGASFIASDALERGMIDAIETPLRVVNSETKTANGGVNPKVKTMDLETLKSQHPALYAAVFEAGFEEGIEEERDRVVSHLNMGESSGDMRIAIKAINEGSKMTSTLQSEYMSAGMKRSDMQARQADDPGSIETPELEESERDKKASDEILKLAKEKLGLEA